MLFLELVVSFISLVQASTESTLNEFEKLVSISEFYLYKKVPGGYMARAANAANWGFYIPGEPKYR